MKSLVKLILSLGIKLAFIALIYAIAMGLTSCRNSCSDIPSFSTANNKETEVMTEASSECVTSVQSEEPETSYSLQAEDKESETSASESIAETTENEMAEQTAQQTSQTTGSSAQRSQVTSTPIPKPTSKPDPTNTPTPKPTATSKPTATPIPEPTATPAPTNTPIPEPTATPKPTNTPKPTPKPVNDPKYTKCIADVEYWAGPDNCYHGIVYGVPCVRNSAGKWETTGKGEDMVWDAIEAEHPDAGGYTDKIVSGSHRNFS